MQPSTPFHPGEREVQTRLGVRERTESVGRRVIRRFMPDQHRDFFASLTFIVAAARDAAGRPWATLLTGNSGFIASPDPGTLEINAQTRPGDALEHRLETGTDLGLLGIELASRRRNRVNGRIIRSRRQCLTMTVDSSFGNCPRYIRQRNWQGITRTASNPSVNRYDHLPDHLHDWLTSADTFFIASGYRGAGDAAFYGMDVSHRGVTPGSLSLTGNRTLTFPDYAGNNHFNTLGNLVLDPRVGLLFVHFDQGHLLQITGRARIDWDSPAVAEVPDAQRLVAVTFDEVVELNHALRSESA